MATWVLFGYLIGSVPFAFLLARRAGIDVRVVGSGNVGAANVLRTSGAALGVTVMALDIAKGAAAVLADSGDERQWSRRWPVAGAAAVVGHIYPVWLRFHGGKGVAVAAGVFSVLAPFATLAVAGGVRDHGLADAARLARLDCRDARAAAGRVAVGCADRRSLVAAVGSGALILFRHRANLGRLVARSERRIGERIAMSERVAILGAGSWGTALAVHCARDRTRGALVGARRRARRRDRAPRENARYLPSISLPDERRRRRPRSRARSTAPGSSSRPSRRTASRRRCAESSASAARRGHRQRDERARGRLAAPHVAGDCAKRPAAGIRSSCSRVRASPSKSRAGCRRRSWSRRLTRRRRLRSRISLKGRRSGSTAATTSRASRSAAR